MNQLRNIFSTTVLHNKTKNVSYSDGNNINRVEVEQKHPRKNESFHESMKFVLFVGQCFTLMPVTGIWSNNLNAITFKLLSLRAIASLIIIAFLLMEIALSTNQVINAFNLSTVSGLVFLAVAFCGFVLLFRLGRRWGSFMRFWAAREDCFLNAPYKENGIRLKYKIKMVAIIFFVMAAIEHGMSIAAAVDFAYRQYSICKIKKISFMHFLFYKERTYMFLVIPFNFFTGLIVTVLTVTSTFCWNFGDILIIVTSIGLTKRFEQLNDRVTEYCKNPGVEIFWIEMREHYVKLIQIQERVDNEMAYIILLSCASDLFFLCLQLFNSFNNAPFLINSIYFWYSLSYLALRSFAVFYSSALIYEASKKPLQLLRHFPIKYWNKNVQRFMDMVKSETVVLSANQFFYLTKSMILGMAGTIITYELVLMQEVKQDPEIRSFCNITRFNISSIL